MAKANWGGNLIGGTGTGAAAGTSVMPGWGTAVGAGLGFVAGIFQSIAEDDNEERKQELLAEISANTGESYNRIEKMYDDFYKKYKPGGTQDDAIEAAKKINDWDENVEKRFAEWGLNSPADYKFNYDKSVEDFLNPYMGKVIDASNAKVTASAAGAGLGRSTGAAKAIAQNTAEEYDKLYNTALGQYNTDRSQSYNEWQAYLNQVNNRLNTMLESDKWSIEQQKALGDDFLSWSAQQLENKANLEKDRINTQTQIALSGL